MPKVGKGRRKRAYRPKTRTGCLTCRIRRVKCDENWPACLRCTSTRRTCDGYSGVSPPPSNIGTVTTGPFDIHSPPELRRSFAFFTHRTSPQLAGFFGSDFWERLVLQAAYHESAVRHAVVAIGSLHELVERQTGIADATRDFALEQYNLAIRELLLQGGERGVDVCLISCILFTCFEIMQGRHASAGSHIRSGVKLLRETIYDQRNGVLEHQVIGSKSHMDCYAPLEVLARIFSVLDPTITMIIGDQKFNKVYESFFSDSTNDDIPFSFSSIEEAKNTFEYGCCLFTSNKAAQLPCEPVDSPVNIEARVGHIATLMSKFSLALQTFIDSKRTSLTPKEDIALSVLKLHMLNAYVSLHVEQPPPDDRWSWDSFVPQIMEMLALGEKVISSTSPGNGQATSTSFCLDMGIVPPLHDITRHCRDPTICRKAIALLRSTSRQEGLWNSHLIANAAERTLEIEHSVLAEMKD